MVGFQFLKEFIPEPGINWDEISRKHGFFQYESTAFRNNFTAFLFRDMIPIGSAAVYLFSCIVTPFATGVTAFINQIWPRIIAVFLLGCLVHLVYLHRQDPSIRTATRKEWTTEAICFLAICVTSINVTSTETHCISRASGDERSTAEAVCANNVPILTTNTILMLFPSLRMRPVAYITA